MTRTMTGATCCLAVAGAPRPSPTATAPSSCHDRKGGGAMSVRLTVEQRVAAAGRPEPRRRARVTHRGLRLRPESTRSGCSRTRTHRGWRSWSRFATLGCSRPPSRSSEARPRSWRLTSHRPLVRASTFSSAAMPTWPTSAGSLPRPRPRLLRQRLRRDVARPVGMGREAPRGEHRRRWTRTGFGAK